VSREPFAAEDPLGSQEPRGHPGACRNQASEVDGFPSRRYAAVHGARPLDLRPASSVNDHHRQGRADLRRPRRVGRSPSGGRSSTLGIAVSVRLHGIADEAARVFGAQAPDATRVVNDARGLGTEAASLVRNEGVVEGGHGELASRGSGSSTSSRIGATEPALSRRVQRRPAGAAGCSARRPRASCLQGPPRPPTAPNTKPR
jgi:hypothetical protein